MSPPSQKYRSDIDGLRGIAILLVIAFHFAPRAMPGGFVGVDVFFVISGYLISSILLADVLIGRFSFQRFYTRRVKRIFPGLILVLLATLALGWLCLWPSEYENLGKHAIGGATFVSNFLLSRETGYFGPQAELKPLLHLWSLGVEEQFYIGFPLLLWLITRSRPSVAMAVLGIIFIVSLSWCGLETVVNPAGGFYLPTTRLWEILLGCLLAVAQADYRNHFCSRWLVAQLQRAEAHARLPWLQNRASVLGMTLVVGAAFCLTQRQAYPADWALIPTLGTAMLIWAGARSWVSQWILSRQVLVALGLISYPLYLWHWPLLFFLRLSPPNPSPIALAGALTLSVLLAALTYWFLERPIRFRRGLGPRTSLVLCTAMAGVCLLGLGAKVSLIPGRLHSLGHHIAEAVKDWHYPFQDNFQRREGFQVDAHIGMDPAHPATLFIGDSQMQQYWPRIQWSLDHRPGQTAPVMLITAGGSPTLPQINRCKPGFACDRFFEFAVQEAGRTNVGTVVFCCWWEAYFIGSFPDKKTYDVCVATDTSRSPLRLANPDVNRVFAEFGQVVGRLVSAGKQIYVILSIPSCPDWSPLNASRFHQRGSDLDRRGVLRKDFEAFVLPVEQRLADVVLANGGKVINPRDAMDEAGVFYGRSLSGEFRYRDGNHLRPFYVQQKATFLDDLILFH